MDPVIIGIILAGASTVVAVWQLLHSRKQTKLSERALERSRNSTSEQKNATRFDSDDARLVTSYATGLRGTLDYLDFRGIVQIERIGVRIKLSDIYIEPILIRASSPSASLDFWGASGVKDTPYSGRESQEDWAPVEKWLERTSCLVVLGEPGVGKTSLIKWLAIRACDLLLDAHGVYSTIRRLPLVVPLTSYAERLTKDSTLPLVDFAEQFCCRSLPEAESCREIIRNSFIAGNCLLLLDGIDEVTDGTLRGSLVERIKQCAASIRLAGNKIVVTSRTTGYQESPIAIKDIEHAILPGFAPTEIKRFVGRWMEQFLRSIKGPGAVVSAEANSEAQKLWREIQRNRSVLQLAGNPLLLTILLLIQHKGIALPERRVELYEFYVRTLIRSWSLARNLDRVPVDPLDEGEAIKILVPMATWMQQECPSGVVEEQVLRKIVAEIVKKRRGLAGEEAEVYANAFLAKIESVSGILIQKSPGQIGFLHYTFQEYLAARGIVLAGQIDRNSILAEIGDRAADPKWQEVVLLCIGYVGIVAREEILASRLIDCILDNPGPKRKEGEYIVRSLVAARAVKDIGVAAISGAAVERVASRLVDVLTATEAALPDRIEAGDLLGSIGDPRLLNFGKIPEIVTIPEGKVTIGSEPKPIEELIRRVEATILKPEYEWLRGYWITSLQSEVPQRMVEVRGFGIGRYPITNAQYREFVLANPAYSLPFVREEELAKFNYTEREIADYQWDSETRMYPAGRANHPVVMVSSEDAAAYCVWLSGVADGRCFRLPKEVEWERACSGITGMRLNEEDRKAVVGNCSESGPKRTTAVGVFSDVVTTCGVSDMLGQVWEWTSTEWEEREAIIGPEEDDVTTSGGSAKIEFIRYVVKGGSWDDSIIFARAPSRGPNRASFRSHYIGFRIAEVIQTDHDEDSGRLEASCTIEPQVGEVAPVAEVDTGGTAGSLHGPVGRRTDFARGTLPSQGRRILLGV